MTIKQALIATISIAGIDDLIVEKTLIDHSLSGSNEYAIGNKNQVDLCAMNALFNVMQQQSVSEGGFSVSYDLEAVKSKMLLLAKNNISDPLAVQIISIYGERNAIKSPSIW